MTRSELMEDVAHVRALAEQGRAAPLLGGGHFLGWGLLLCATYAAHYAIVTQIAAGPGLGAWLGGLWAGFGVTGTIMAQVLGRRIRDRPGLGSVGNRANRSIWAGVSLALLAIVLGALLRMIMFRDYAAPDTILPAAFALYGAAMIGSFSLSGEKMLRTFGGAAIAVGAIAGVITPLPEMYLFGSAGALVVLAWPGILLLRREPAAAV